MTRAPLAIVREGQISLTPSCSIVMPAYNRADVIGRAIQSVLTQSFEDFELIIVDDGSCDNTLEVASSFDDPRVRIYKLERNSGSAHARNRGIEIARGQWIAFQDSDDEWLPTLLERHAANFARPEIDVSFCQLRQQYAAETRFFPPDGVQVPEAPTALIIAGPIMSSQTLAVRAPVLRRIGAVDEALPSLEDWELGIRLSRQHRFAYIAEPLAIAYESENSMTKNVGSFLKARSAIIEKHEDLFRRFPASLARHRYILGRQHHQRGERGAAINQFVLSVSSRPLYLKAWAGMLASLTLVPKRAAT
jgi:GT2 family glycosyltransferase